LNAFSSLALPFFFPTRCGVCGLLGDELLCEACQADFRPVERATRLDVDRFKILFHYTGRAGQAVRRLKFSRVTAVAKPMADMLAAVYEREFADEVDLIVPVPLHWSRRSNRGFNQSELLCFKLPEELVRPWVLRRIRATHAQVTLDPAARLTNLQGAFAADPRVAGKAILLVDDVVTSGTTASECALTLKRAGAESVALLAFAGAPYLFVSVAPTSGCLTSYAQSGG
jgi:ComF family protein